MIKSCSKKVFSILLVMTIFITVLSAAMFSVNATSSMKTSENGINLIKLFEGFSKEKYEDGNQWTIGYGSHCGEDDYPNGITETQAVALLKSQLPEYEGYVNTFLNKYNLMVNQNQFDAMVSFTYNLGNVWITTDNFTLRNYFLDGIEKYSDDDIAYAFGLWCKADGKVVQGLVNRRAAEAALFCQEIQAQYTISYNANGGTGAPSSVTCAGGKSFLLSTVVPSKIGYSFLGWTTDKSNTTNADYLPGDAYIANSNTTFYAVWKKSYTIQYNYNVDGQSTDYNPTIKLEGVDISLSDTIPKRVGYTFLGWAKNNPYAEEPTYLPGDVVTEDEDMILFAVWQRYITVALDTQGGQFTTLSDITLGDLNSDGAIDAEDINLLFSITQGTQKPDTVMSKAGDLNLDGAINELDLILFEDYLDGTLPSLPAICISKDSLISKVPTPVKEGLYFKGWIGQGDFTLKSNTTSETDDSENLVYNTLYAVWSDTPNTGDIDHDGQLSVSDVIALRKRIMNGSEDLSDTEKSICDVNGDGILSVSDIISLRTLIMKS